MTFQFEIIERDWYKRRSPKEAIIKPVSVTIPDYTSTHNHMCKMHVVYSDKSEKSLIGRVIYNKLNDRWTVDGMELAVNVVEA
ncbi:hypothetical protein HII17_13250 [Thalassotalea sp. M1531]|uniref:Uncharacterized protein n=1 Tax=Thalassotalea algicola TaxID=2716224 RepID=A0A7Y0LG10_9GAMM|nr:hypothetical protein [Thalassotalea algicola]NMP32530.1 hypothetical protein [Thalassotalea algicola]